MTITSESFRIRRNNVPIKKNSTRYVVPSDWHGLLVGKKLLAGMHLYAPQAALMNLLTASSIPPTYFARILYPCIFNGKICQEFLSSSLHTCT